MKAPCVVVLIHGLGRTSRSLGALSGFLQHQGFKTHAFSYHSRRDEMSAITQQLHATLTQLRQQYQQIHLVTHSLGGIVVRTYLAEQATQPDYIGHIVMLAPPHHGSEIIDFWQRGALRQRFFQTMMGPVTKGLHTQQPAPPLLNEYKLGIIAGTRSIEFWFAHLFNQANDGKVSVESTRLHTHPHICIKTTHTFMMNHNAVRLNMLQFLKNGAFL